MKKIIFKYVKNRKGRPVGCVLAKGDTSGFTVGWSLTHPNDLNKNGACLKEKAREIAEGRADKAGNLNDVPYSIYPEVEKMLNRGTRYFKSSNANRVNDGLLLARTAVMNMLRNSI